MDHCWQYSVPYAMRGVGTLGGRTVTPDWGGHGSLPRELTGELSLRGGLDRAYQREL